MKLVRAAYFLIGAWICVEAMHGGNESDIGRVPYTAQLLRVFENSGLSFCGATILSEYWLLTAAHCVKKENRLLMYVKLGSNDTEIQDVDVTYNISEIIPHANFNIETRWNNDIALIKLETPIEFDEIKKPINISRHSPRLGDTVILSGYGYDYNFTFQEHLKLGRQSVIDISECRMNYRKTEISNISLEHKLFCTDPKTTDACHGDSGSPAVLHDKLVGVAVEGCQSPLPNIYVDVAQHCDWISRETGLKCS